MTLSSGPRHGGEVYSLARKMHTTPDKLLDFSSNTNIFAYDLTQTLVQNTPYPFLHYPDTTATDLVQAIAAHERISPERILPGNGAAELIWLTLQALTPRKIFFIGPVFSEWITACNAYDIPFDILTPPAENEFCCTSEDLEKVWETDADLVIICSPNNPAGVTYANMHSVLHMLRAPRVLIDSSYREFLYGNEIYDETSYHVYHGSIRPGVSLFTLHSFTKFFCCPGIRLGYIMGDRNQITRIEALRPSWTISPYSQIMGQKFLEHLDAYRETLPDVNMSVAHMGRELRRMDCINADRVFEGPSFLCCGLSPRFNAASVCKALLNRRYIVRECDSIPGMPSGYIRIQARPDHDTSRLFSALETLYMDALS